MYDSTVNFWKGGIKSKSAVQQALALNRKPWMCDHCGESMVFDEGSSPEGSERASGWRCTECGGVTYRRRRIFSLSLGDWLDPEVPIWWLAEMLDTIRRCDQCVWILCTKRPELWAKMMGDVMFFEDVGKKGRHAPIGAESELWKMLHAWKHGSPPPNIILLASVENQEQANSRIPQLLQIPAACHGLSLELGPVNVTQLRPQKDEPEWLLFPLSGEYVTEGMNEPARLASGAKLDWLIIGGESGPNARPCNMEWVRSLVAQGKAAGVATFGRFEPADLRVQEWPKGF